jgi:SAM-dependent methyltransferase
MAKTDALPPSTQYNSNYGNFQKTLYAEIRREAFGEDIGQNSWITASELDGFARRLELQPGKTLLDIACGAGGPALRVAATTGCSVVGIDRHEQAIDTARALAEERGLSGRATFRAGDASARLPLADASFDAVLCIDAINHFPDRPRLLSEWVRVLKPGGRLLFTDPITVTGPLTNAEIAARSAGGFYLFVPHGYDEGLLGECGLRLMACEDVTANMAGIAAARHLARANRREALCEIEGEAEFNTQQNFLEVAARIAREGRLSRFLYVAAKH